MEGQFESKEKIIFLDKIAYIVTEHSENDEIRIIFTHEKDLILKNEEAKEFLTYIKNMKRYLARMAVQDLRKQ